MIAFSNVIADNLEAPLDFSLPAGKVASLVTAREAESEAVIRLLLGFRAPLSGAVTVNGVSPASLRDSELADFRRGIGVVFHDGGLISNLSLWENLTLQLSFDGGLKRAELEERAMASLELVGFNGSISTLPGRITLYQRKQVAIARLLMSAPDIVIYHAVFDGLSHREQGSLASVIAEYCKKGRTALLVTTNADLLKRIEPDFRFHTGGTLQP